MDAPVNQSAVVGSTPQIAPIAGNDSGGGKRGTQELVREYMASLKAEQPAAAPAQESRLEAESPAPLPQAELGANGTSNEAASPALDYVEVDGRKIPVDFSNREELKRIVKARYDHERGFRKMQVERDQSRTEMSKMQEELQKLKTNWSAMDKAFQEQGEEGLIDLLRGKPGAHQEWLKQKIDRHEFLRSATPAEKEALEARERESRYLRELEREREASKKFREDIEATREAAEVKQIQGVFDDAARKHGFSGKLGDAADEEFFDDMLFNQVKTNLAALDEKQLNPELIQKEFSEVAGKLRKRVSAQAEKQASKVLGEKKQAAAEAVQTAVRNSANPDSRGRQEAHDLVKSGSVAKLLSGWGKFGQYL